jgi:uncharacterized protein
MAYARRAAWVAGWPVRSILLVLIRAYRLTLGHVIGGNCRFYPTCSAYAEQAVAQCGAMRGGTLAVWRILRCSPLSGGGIDRPPQPLYDSDIRQADAGRRGAAA